MSSAFAALRSATRAHSSRLAAHRSANATRTLARAYSSSTQDGTRKQDGAQQEADASSQPQQANANAKSKADDPCADVSAKLKAKEAEVVDVTGRLRYLQADFLNLQRNAAREKEQTRDFAISRFAGDLLETVDVLALALKSVPAEYTAAALSASTSSSSTSSSSSSTTTPSTDTAKEPSDHLRELYNGVELTHRLLLQTLFKYHVKPFDPTGDRFDPNRHEALYQAPVPGKEPGSVIDCQKVGFMIKDRVLRAAQVGVAQEVQS